MTLEERLNATINEQEERIAELEQRVAQAEWERWTSHEAHDEDLADDLPCPRLEIVWVDGRFRGEKIAYYHLIYRHYCGHYELVPFGRTVMSGSEHDPIRNDGSIEPPRKDGFHILSDALELNLPAYIRCKGHIERLDPETVREDKERQLR